MSRLPDFRGAYRCEGVDLEAAVDALATLVFAEYPERYTLAEIAETWGEGITPEQIEALRHLEAPQ